MNENLLKSMANDLKVEYMLSCGLCQGIAGAQYLKTSEQVYQAMLRLDRQEIARLKQQLETDFEPNPVPTEEEALEYFDDRIAYGKMLEQSIAKDAGNFKTKYEIAKLLKFKLENLSEAETNLLLKAMGIDLVVKAKSDFELLDKLNKIVAEIKEMQAIGRDKFPAYYINQIRKQNERIAELKLQKQKQIEEYKPLADRYKFYCECIDKVVANILEEYANVHL